MDREAVRLPQERTALRFRWQANLCAALGSPLYAGLLGHAADDLLTGGPTLAVLDGHLDDKGAAAPALRMLGGVHALVLTGRAAELAAFYPSAGGKADAGPGADRAWPALREVLAERSEEVRRWLGHPPQTNEVGRGAALAGALARLVAEADLPIRLIEVGASAGLNLRVDHFAITGGGQSFGPAWSPVRLHGAWLGPAPAARKVDIVDRIGADIAPVDPLSDAGRLRLSSYVWADQIERFQRLRGAFELAAAVPAELRAEPVSRTVGGIGLEPGTWTVLWHSIMRQYLDEEEAAALDAGIAALGEQATPSARFAHVSLEPVRRELAGEVGGTPVKLVTWPNRQRRILGTAPPHGIPVRWKS